MAFTAAGLAAALDALDAGWRSERLCVAFSGGLDSTVLLHALAVLARESGTPIRAIHVDHGLQPESPAWARSGSAACGRLGVPYSTLELALVPARGESLEAAAREARYAALAAALTPGERLLTAHHRDDQLETALIQLLRGAGVAGLAAMPGRAPLGPGWLLRPLLGFDRAELEAWAAAEGIAWLEDPMNADPRFDRAWLRQRVLPALRERWPAAATTVARSSAHLAEASRILAATAAADAESLIDDGRLSAAGLAALGRERRSNVLRWWLQGRGLRPPPATRLGRALDELLAARVDGAPRLAWPGGEIRRYRGRLYALPGLPAMPLPGPLGAEPRELGPGLGRFGLVPGNDGGLCALKARQAELRFRGGGESIAPQAGRPRKRLKDLCQEAGIVPWMRGRLPLVYVEGTLAAVADLWVDAAFAAGPGAPALKPVWEERPPLR